MQRSLLVEFDGFLLHFVGLPEYFDEELFDSGGEVASQRTLHRLHHSSLQLFHQFVLDVGLNREGVPHLFQHLQQFGIGLLEQCLDLVDHPLVHLQFVLLFLLQSFLFESRCFFVVYRWLLGLFLR